MDAALKGRLAKLKMTGDCCADLPGVLRAARDRPGLEDARRRYEALADPSRLLVVAMLDAQPDLCGCELQAALRLSHATVSHHMRILEDAGLVVGERRGKWMHYQLTPTATRLLP